LLLWVPCYTSPSVCRLPCAAG